MIHNAFVDLSLPRGHNIYTSIGLGFLLASFVYLTSEMYKVVRRIYYLVTIILILSDIIFNWMHLVVLSQSFLDLGISFLIGGAIYPLLARFIPDSSTVTARIIVGSISSLGIVFIYIIPSFMLTP
jgi:hypothetical protein